MHWYWRILLLHNAHHFNKDVECVG
jgi:hypothetical protein